MFAAARRTDRLEELARETSGTVVPVTMDVCDRGSIDRAVAIVAEHAPGGIDVLVNNAGYALTGPLETIASDAFRAQYVRRAGDERPRPEAPDRPADRRHRQVEAAVDPRRGEAGRGLTARPPRPPP